MLRTPPEETIPHKCELPDIWNDDSTDYLPKGSYFECDVCGMDWVIAKELGDYDWYRVRWFNRRKIRARVGIDEHCQDCGYRSHRQFIKDVNAQKRSGSAVRVGYRCSDHEKHLKENFVPPEPISMLGKPAPFDLQDTHSDDFDDRSWVKDPIKVKEFWRDLRSRHGK